ncbi:MAG: hypothetical protein Q9191_007497, partial [Dirinaria sp. TL-2023a]
MRSIAVLALALPLLVAADSIVYPWDTDPNWQPSGGWPAPTGGWGSVDYSGNSNNKEAAQPASNSPAPAANPPVSSPAAPAAPAASPANSGTGQKSSSIADPVQPLPSSPSNGGSQPQSTPTPTPTHSSSPPTITTLVASTPTTTGAGSSGSSGGSCSTTEQAIELQNISGQDLIIQASAPWVVGQCGTIAHGSTCTLCQARGSTGGNLQLGYGMANGRGTWIEGNWDVDAQFPTLDISYIPGYSVPILCTGSDGSSTIGMSDPLCSDENCSNCESGGGTWSNNACLNPMGSPDTVKVNGPAPDFFSSATGIVYTYPFDDHDGYAPAWNSAK